MRAIDVSIGHDDDLVVAQLFDVKFFFANPRTQCRDQGTDLVGGQHLVETGPFNIEDLAAQGQNRLIATMTALFSRATRGITLHQE